MGKIAIYPILTVSFLCLNRREGAACEEWLILLPFWPRIMGKRITITALAATLLFALVLRISLQREELFYPDSCVYLSMAENMKQGDFSRSIFPGVALHQPLYSLLTAAISLTGSTVETAGMAVSVISGLGLVLAPISHSRARGVFDRA